MTPDWTPTPVVFATAAPVAAAPTAEAVAPAQPETTAEPAAAEAPTAEPAPAEANTVVRLTATQTVNARPRTGHQLPRDRPPERLGQAYPVTGKNARGDWYQFDLDGQPAWVIANLVNVSSDPAAIQVAQNIPPVPTARPTARPQPHRPHRRRRPLNRNRQRRPQRLRIRGSCKPDQFAALPSAGQSTSTVRYNTRTARRKMGCAFISTIMVPARSSSPAAVGPETATGVFHLAAAPETAKGRLKSTLSNARPTYQALA